MPLLSIKIKIGDRIYPMKVQQKDEAFVRQASKLLEERIDTYKKNMHIQDQQDLLAMVAFDCLVESLKTQKQRETETDNLLQKLKQWNIHIEQALHPSV